MIAKGEGSSKDDTWHWNRGWHFGRSKNNGDNTKDKTNTLIFEWHVTEHVSGERWTDYNSSRQRFLRGNYIGSINQTSLIPLCDKASRTKSNIGTHHDYVTNTKTMVVFKRMQDKPLLVRI